jgi:hypothetical protein
MNELRTRLAYLQTWLAEIISHLKIQKSPSQVRQAREMQTLEDIHPQASNA